MKRTLLSLLLVFCMVFSLAACGESNKDKCNHRDADDNGRCDKCSLSYEDNVDILPCQHRDANDDEKCDYCKVSYKDGKDVDVCRHRDVNDDGLCDVCNEIYMDGIDILEGDVCQHRDADDDNNCDKCKLPYQDGIDTTPCQHRDADDDTVCDNCGAYYEDGKDILNAPLCQHRDADDDNKCDKCGNSYADGIDVVHTHIGEWAEYGDNEGLPCDQKILYRACTSCGTVEWKTAGYENHSFVTKTIAPTCEGQGYDEKTCTVCGFVDKVNYTDPSGHTYATTYSTDASFHWLACANCDSKSAHGEHTVDESGLCSVCGQPLAPTEGIIYDVSADGTYAEVIGYYGTATKLLIADTYNGLPVKNIYTEAFKNNDSIVLVVIPDSVTTIENSAFYDCDGLKTVVVGDGVETIGEYAFYDCYYIESLTIGNSVKTIGSYAFQNCDRITSLIIPDSVTSISSRAFYDCDGLTSVVIGNGVTSIGSEAFESCDSLASVSIGNSVTSIGSEAFYYCSNLKGVYIADLAAWCGISFSNETANPLYYAKKLYLNNELITNLVIPDSVTSISSRAFYDCDGLTSVIIGNGVTSIGSEAFESCGSLASVSIGNSVTSIDSEAFYNCYNLASVSIDSNLAVIGSNAFSACNSALYTEYAFGQYIGDSENPYAILLAITNKNLRTYTIHEDTKIIACTFSDCARMTSITIPNNVGYVHSSLLQNCSNLQKVTIGSGVANLPSSMFSGCSNLQSVTILGSPTINSGVFSGCVPSLYTEYANCKYVGDADNPYAILVEFTNKNLSTCEIHKDTKFIAGRAFYDCDSLTSVVIPDSVETLGANAFAYCDQLSEITLGESLVSIGSDVFSSCYSLTSVYITDIAAWCNIVFGDSYANPLCYAKNLYLNGELITELIIPEGVTKIPNYAFKGQSSITSVTIPDSVTTIGSYAFYNCDSLTSVVIPDSVTTIGSYAFSSCDGLTSIKYRGTQTQWNAISKGSSWNWNTGSYTITYNYTGN